MELFNELTSEQMLETTEALLPEHRERLYPPTVTLSMFMRQALEADGSCQKAVNGWAALYCNYFLIATMIGAGVDVLFEQNGARNSEVVRYALRDWTHKRRLREQGVAELGQVWQAALRNATPGVSADQAINRLERKYQATTDAEGTAD